MSRWRLTRATAGNAVTILALLGLAVWLATVQSEAVPAPSFEAGRMGWAAAWIAAYALLCAIAWWDPERVRSAQAATGLVAPGDGDAVPATDSAMAVVFARQTGFADELAHRTADLLNGAGVPARAQPLGSIDSATLGRQARMLFVVSTTGEGDAPDDAIAFTRHVMSTAPDLSRLRYGLLALGDSDYALFCAFGRRLDAWLQRHGAQPLFDAVDVDNGDAAALRHWHHHVALVAGRTDLPDWQAPGYSAWRLAERTLLNPGSQGGACYRIALTPPDGVVCDWRAGDIVEIGPRNDPAAVTRFLTGVAMDGASLVPGEGGTPEPLADILSRCLLPDPPSVAGSTPSALVARLSPLPHREYSIASLPADGRIELLVRQMHRPDGQVGLGSGWLTAHAGIGDGIAALVRRNAAFHPPADTTPLILIGNGTGMAGLRAHLKARVAAGCRRNWLLFGERHADRDFFLREEILRWQAQGWIERLDLAFSRDQASKVYVQDRLREHGAELLRWLDDGAAIYVCGSLDGMAPGVHAVLAQLVGEDGIADLVMARRYCRDVY